MLQAVTVTFVSVIKLYIGDHKSSHCHSATQDADISQGLGVLKTLDLEQGLRVLQMKGIATISCPWSKPSMRRSLEARFL